MQPATTPSRKLVVKVNRAVKTYGTTRALAGANVEIYAGEVLGIVGHNGAGKSTLMRVLTGLAVLDSGSVDVAGVARPEKDGFTGVRMAYQEGSLAFELTVKENIYLSSTASPVRMRTTGIRANRGAGRSPELTLPSWRVTAQTLSVRMRTPSGRA